MESLLVPGIVILILAMFAWKLGKMIFNPMVIIAIIALFYLGLLPAAAGAIATVAKTTAGAVYAAASSSFSTQ